LFTSTCGKAKVGVGVMLAVGVIVGMGVTVALGEGLGVEEAVGDGGGVLVEEGLGVLVTVLVACTCEGVGSSTWLASGWIRSSPQPVKTTSASTISR
jgi:hypothetical protein